MYSDNHNVCYSRASILTNTLITHDMFEYGLRMLEQCFQGADGTADSVGLPIIGPSRAGKTSLLKAFLSNHPAIVMDDRTLRPATYCKVPNKPTVKGLVERLLEAVGDPRPDKGTEIGKTSRLKRLIKDLGVRVQLLDEFQHFVDKTSKRIQYHASDFIKELMDDTKINIVVTGLPYCLNVIKQNEQLNGRFLREVEFKRLDWSNEFDRAEFIRILSQWQSALSTFDMPVLADNEMAFRFHCASEGLMGYIVKILRQIIWNADTEGTNIIDLEDIELAYVQTIGEGANVINNPFSQSFSCNDIQPDQNHDLEQSSPLGQRSEHGAKIGRQSACS